MRFTIMYRDENGDYQQQEGYVKASAILGAHKFGDFTKILMANHQSIVVHENLSTVIAIIEGETT